MFIREVTDAGRRAHCLACGSFFTEDMEYGSTVEGWERQHRVDDRSTSGVN